MLNSYLKFIGCIAACLAILGIAAIGYEPGLLAALVDAWTADPQAVVVNAAKGFTTIWIFVGILVVGVGFVGGTVISLVEFTKKRRAAQYKGPAIS